MDKSLLNMKPELAAQWHPTRNGDLTPDQVTLGSGKKVWWQCDKGHEWEAKVYSISASKTNGCPYCNGAKVLKGFNDLVTTHPEIAAQWNYNLNGDLKPYMLMAGAANKVWWKCGKGHEWQSTCNDRKQGRGCSKCYIFRPVNKEQSLAELNPELASQWDFKNNEDIDLSKISPKSTYVAWWKCDKGHSWQSAIANRNRGTGCTYCINHKILEGFNDLATVNPELAKQWHPTKNGEKLPSHLSASSNQKVWWQCSKGHEWEATCNDRTRGFGCLRCSAGIQSSKQEKEIAEYIKALLPDVKIETSIKSVIKPYELDIYIPDKNIAVEYNGLYWHSEENGKDKSYHYNKWLACKEQGIQLIQIWEDDYIRSPEIVKQMLAHKLGASKQVTVYARKTSVKALTKNEADDFLNNNHIQGSVDARLRYGLFHGEELVSVILFKNETGTQGKTLNLIRYATSKNVAGGFTKLLKHAERENPNVESIVTFSDNTVSDGGLYLNNGFVEDGIIKPDYSYIANGMRNHKFSYRLKRFKADPNLEWVEGYTETELAKLNSLRRIWDAGKVKWKKTIQK